MMSIQKFDNKINFFTIASGVCLLATKYFEVANEIANYLSQCLCPNTVTQRILNCSEHFFYVWVNKLGWRGQAS